MTAPVLATNGFPTDILEQGIAGVESLARAGYVHEQAKEASTQRRSERDTALAWTGDRSQFAEAHFSEADARLITPVVEDGGIGFWPQIEMPMFRKKL